MSIWHSKFSIEGINEKGKNTMAEQIGIEFVEFGPDYLKARMPVDHRSIQPAGILHGGASVALAETIGSVGAYLTVDPEKSECVGLEINANHVRSAKNGYVYGTGKPIHLGKSTQIWEIRITNDKDLLLCISRITMAVLNKTGL
ncbi:MAG: hotdog fold thioesterase [Calditrichaceae bacterium]